MATYQNTLHVTPFDVILLCCSWNCPAATHSRWRCLWSLWWRTRRSQCGRACLRHNRLLQRILLDCTQEFKPGSEKSKTEIRLKDEYYWIILKIQCCQANSSLNFLQAHCGGWPAKALSGCILGLQASRETLLRLWWWGDWRREDWNERTNSDCAWNTLQLCFCFCYHVFCNLYHVVIMFCQCAACTSRHDTTCNRKLQCGFSCQGRWISLALRESRQTSGWLALLALFWLTRCTCLIRTSSDGLVYYCSANHEPLLKRVLEKFKKKKTHCQNKYVNHELDYAYALIQYGMCYRLVGIFA